MRLRPDDEIRRARLVYLGPGKTALPVQWPYAKWALYAAVALPLSGLLYLTFGTVLAMPVAFAAALFPASYIFDRVDPDRPARRVIRTLLTDWRADPDPGTDPAETPLPPLDARAVRLPTHPRILDGDSRVR